MRVVWSVTAIRDLNELSAWIVVQDPGTAEKVSAAIDKCIDFAKRQPKVGTRLNRPNSFRLPIRRYGIAVFYRVRPRRKELEIVRVVRGARVRSL